MLQYRLLVFGCALSWLMLGLHLPVLHYVIHHGRPLPWSVAGALLMLSVAAVATLWLLLRRSAPPQPGHKAPALRVAAQPNRL